MESVVFVKQKTAYDMRISDWSSDVCSSDLPCGGRSAPKSDQRHRNGPEKNPDRGIPTRNSLPKPPPTGTVPTAPPSAFSLAAAIAVPAAAERTLGRHPCSLPAVSAQ